MVTGIRVPNILRGCLLHSHLIVLFYRGRNYHSKARLGIWLAAICSSCWLSFDGAE